MLGLFAVVEDLSSLLGALIFNSLYPVARAGTALKGGALLLAAAGVLAAVAALLPCLPKRREKGMQEESGKVNGGFDLP